MPVHPYSVLVAVDFGDASSRAVSLAGIIAEQCGIPLRLLHAESIEAPPYFTHDQLESLEQQRQSIRAQAEQFLTRYGRQHTKYPFAAIVADGEPAAAILHHAHDGDVIVMGTHGRRGPKRWWLGSVAERVLRETTHPLFVVRADEVDVARFTRDIHQCFVAALTSTPHTFVVTDAPVPRTATWLAQHGEPLVRSCRLPVLFVPETREGAKP